MPVSERLLIAPQIIIDSLNDYDKVDNYSPHKLNDNEKQLFMNYFDLLPAGLQKAIVEKVIGIYFIDNFLGGGMTLQVYDNNGNMNIALFFNPEILHTNISEWINFRDNSAFLPDDKLSVIVTCNSNYFALIHTLFHEASHVYDFSYSITPSENQKPVIHTDFTRNIWTSVNEPIEEYNFSNRNNLSFYGFGESLDKKHALTIYSSLANTPFSSLYGSTTCTEDFAEAFTWYCLKKNFEINYVTQLKENDKIIFTHDPDDNELVKSRYKTLDEILRADH